MLVIMLAWEKLRISPKYHQLATSTEIISSCLQNLHFSCATRTIPGRVNAHSHCVTPPIWANFLNNSCTHAATRWLFYHGPAESLLSLTHCPYLCFKIFYPETTDIYDRKNMPRCIYCIHALRYSICFCLSSFVFLWLYNQASGCVAGEIILLICITNWKPLKKNTLLGARYR